MKFNVEAVSDAFVHGFSIGCKAEFTTQDLSDTRTAVEADGRTKTWDVKNDL